MGTIFLVSHSGVDWISLHILPHIELDVASPTLLDHCLESAGK